MRTKATLAAEKRASRGKGEARRLRAGGRIPAVVYGGDSDSMPIHVDAHDTLLLFRQISVENTIVQLGVEGEDASFDTLVREVQAHPLRPEILHVDFYRVQAGVKVEVQVPIHIEGVPEGVRLEGGLLELIVHDLPIRSLPSEIPEQIVLDVTDLKVGDSVHASDLVLPEGAELMLEDERTICSIAMPKLEEEPEVEEDEEGEGVELVGEEGEEAGSEQGSDGSREESSEG